MCAVCGASEHLRSRGVVVVLIFVRVVVMMMVMVMVIPCESRKSSYFFDLVVVSFSRVLKPLSAEPVVNLELD